MFTWQLKMGEHTTLGTGQNKKMAKNTAAEQMMSVLPDAWKQQAVNRMKRKGSKRRSGGGGRGGYQPPAKKKAEEEDGKIHITADNPVSCLYEYAKKAKIPDPGNN